MPEHETEPMTQNAQTSVQTETVTQGAESLSQLVHGRLAEINGKLGGHSETLEALAQLSKGIETAQGVLAGAAGNMEGLAPSPEQDKLAVDIGRALQTGEGLRSLDRAIGAGIEDALAVMRKHIDLGAADNLIAAQMNARDDRQWLGHVGGVVRAAETLSSVMERLQEIQSDFQKTGNLESAVGKLQQAQTWLAATLDVQASSVLSETPSLDTSRYAMAAADLVHQLRNAASNGQTFTNSAGKHERVAGFLNDDRACDCAKFVLKAMMNADGVDYSKNDLWGISVPGFGGEKAVHLTSVTGMKSAVESLVAKNAANPIRPQDPRVGDVIFWYEAPAKEGDGPKGHVTIVTGVVGKGAGATVTFAAAGGGLPTFISATYQQLATNATFGPRHTPLGDGKFLGFWTPPGRKP